MRLTKVDIIVSNRGLCEYNLCKQGKAVSSSLAIGKKTVSSSSSSKDDPDVFMMLCTAQNRGGTKYSCADGNVEKVFTKFVEEGKATIRFKSPAHDLCITKCNVVELKAFLTVLRKVVECKDLSGLTLSAMAPASLKQVTKSKTKMCVTQKKDYPITTGFPHTLESLQVIGINLRRFDSRILKLRNLVTLDLSDNAVPDVPDEIHQLRRLSEFRLSGNQIERLSPAFFRGALCQTLRLLDLSNNKMKVVPNQISNFSVLTTLKLDGNQLDRLPFSLGKISSLRHLSASGNQIKTLPGTLTRASLETLDLSANPLTENDGGKLLLENLAFPPLLDLAIVACLKYDIRPKEEDVPATVRNYMESFLRCQCGRICLSSKAIMLVPFSFSRISRTMSCDGRQEGMFEAVICSRKCLEKYKNNPFAL